MEERLLQLPFDIQIILATGYLAYRLATTGLDKKHRPGDFAFQVLVYGAIAKAFQEAIIASVGSYWLAAFGAAILTLAAAALWRRYGRGWLVIVLRKFGVTRENYHPSAWDAILNGGHAWRYVSVRLSDDTCLDSDIDQLPEDLPHGPLDVDTEGNIALYVTSRTTPEGEETDFRDDDVRDEHGRAHITFVPASQISRITISLDSPTTS